jgi:hypothetical protein
MDWIPHPLAPRPTVYACVCVCQVAVSECVCHLQVPDRLLEFLEAAFKVVAKEKVVVAALLLVGEPEVRVACRCLLRGRGEKTG